VSGRDERFDAQEAARLTRVDVTVVARCAEMGLVTPPPRGYTEADLAEIRRVRRLHDDLGLDYGSIEVVLDMLRRIRDLQVEVRRLESVLSSKGSERPADWTEAEWEESR
jgi:DNA-binding transcriptional MerR regulator